MVTIKKKWRKNLRCIWGFILAGLLISSLFSIAVYATTSTMPDITDMIPDGTNIPDTDIGGATGNDSSMLPNTSASPDSSAPSPSSSSPSATSGLGGSSSSTGTSPIGDANGSDTIGGVIGVIIAIIVVLAVILLIIALVPKRTDVRDNSDRTRKK